MQKKKQKKNACAVAHAHVFKRQPEFMNSHNVDGGDGVWRFFLFVPSG